MKTKSILFKIHITFFISFVLLTISALELYHMLEKREDFFFHKRGFEIARIFLDDFSYGLDKKQIQGKMQRFNFIVIDDPKKIDLLLQDHQLKKGHIEQIKDFNLEYFKIKERHYVYLFSPDKKILLEDQTAVTTHFSDTILIYFSILSIFGFLYFSIIQRLKPLGELNDLVKSFGEENFDIKYVVQGEDEIANLAREFVASAEKLKSIKESRNIFIRNMMHELKTPITKGKFLTHLPATDENIEKMQKVFYRLESLINEFAAIEELVSVKKVLHVREYFLEDIIDNAMDILLCEEHEVIRELENKKMAVDFDIFSIAVKNLLDNGIKYSLDKKIIIKTQGDKIIFENRANSLDYSIENYFEPFFKGKDVKSNQGFGLGLYIIKHILDAHGFTLKYEYQDENIRFILEKSLSHV
jgi:two-component system OmpR family sensor kinase